MSEQNQKLPHKSLFAVTRQAFMFRWDMLMFNLAYVGKKGQFAALSTVGLVIFASFFMLQTQLSLTAQVENQYQHKVNQPISIRLGQYVRTPSTMDIVPQIAGTWSSEGSIKTGTTMYFRPTSGQLPADTTYTVTLSGIKRVTGQTVPNKTLVIKSEAAKGIKNVSPKAGEAVSRNTAVKLELDGQNNGVRKLRAEFTPAMPYTVIEKDDTTFIWSFNAPLEQGSKYVVKIYDDNTLTKTPIATTEFSVHAAPTVSVLGRGFYYPGDSINMTFSKPMNQVNRVLEGIDGTGQWKSATEYAFTPSNLVVAKQYDFNLVKNLTATDESVIEAPFAATIKTPGAVTAQFGGVSNNADTKQPITITFDQAVNRKTAEERFSISPKVEGGLSWRDDKTMIFNPAGYDQQSKYVVSIAAGVSPVTFGLPGQGNTASLITKAVEFRLNVPLYRQQHVSSCEAASLRMALAYRGIYKNDIEIVQTFGYNPRPIDTITNSWDDPNEMYVGDVNGLQSKLHGYGAHAAPIAKGARTYGRDATAHFNVGVNFIAEQILAGNPVVIIGTAGAGNARRVTWNGPNGVVEAWYGEHARTVVGVVGKANNPVGFIVHDPLVSKPLYWTPAQLQRDIDATPQVPSQVVVVR